jgi:hypothetical protein
MIGCSLYTPIVNEIGPAPNAWSPPKWSPSRVLGSDKCFLFQLPCSWGALYSSKHWLPFLQYYSQRFWINSAPDAPNSRTVEWFMSWKRHLVELMLEHSLFLLYPFVDNSHTSYSTNYFEKGVHSGPLNHDQVYNDTLKKFDHRFTVPLITNSSLNIEVISECRSLTNPVIFNLYHQPIHNIADLKVSMRTQWSERHYKELMVISDEIATIMK